MNQQPPAADAAAGPKKKKMSAGAKWGLGCGIGCLSVIVIGVVVITLVTMSFLEKADTAAEIMRTEHGLTNLVSRQDLSVREDIDTPTVYKGQMVKISGDCSTDIGIVAQVAEIHGTVEGKVYFCGQILIIQPGAEIKNGIEVVTFAQIIKNEGKVTGGIVGPYQQLDDSGATVP
jgi:hypothetical protein